MPTTSSPRSKGISRRERILNYLSSQGGRVDSVDGRGLTLKMATRVGYDNIAALNAILARLERDGQIVRNVRGKRTYSIALRRQPPRGSRGPVRPGTARANGQARSARKPQVRSMARTASSGGRRPTTGRGPTATRRAGAGSNLPQLFAALGNELLALRKQNEDMSRRLAALEGAARTSARRTNGRRAA